MKYKNGCDIVLDICEIALKKQKEFDNTLKEDK